MGSAVAWVLWSGLLDHWAWVLYLAVGICPALVGQQNGIQGLHGLFQDLNLGRVYTEFPLQTGATGFALQMGKAMDCALCSSATVSRADGWAT